MSRSVLLQLARDSIQEVFEAKRNIDRSLLLQTHSLLNQVVVTQVNIFLDGKVRGSAKEEMQGLILLESIVKNAKKAAFEDKDFPPLSVSEYLSCEVEVILFVDGTQMSEKDTKLIDSMQYIL
jgi:AMMECR1 domain-containing protein